MFPWVKSQSFLMSLQSPADIPVTPPTPENPVLPETPVTDTPAQPETPATPTKPETPVGPPADVPVGEKPELPEVATITS